MNMLDRDIEECYAGFDSDEGPKLVYINYYLPTWSTHYSREDLLFMLSLLDKGEEK